MSSLKVSTKQLGIIVCETARIRSSDFLDYVDEMGLEYYPAALQVYSMVYNISLIKDTLFSAYSIETAEEVTTCALDCFYKMIEENFSENEFDSLKLDVEIKAIDIDTVFLDDSGTGFGSIPAKLAKMLYEDITQRECHDSVVQLEFAAIITSWIESSSFLIEDYKIEESGAKQSAPNNNSEPNIGSAPSNLPPTSPVSSNSESVILRIFKKRSAQIMKFLIEYEHEHPDAHFSPFDLFAAMYVITDLAMSYTHKDRKSAASEIREWFINAFFSNAPKEQTNSRFDKRVNFFAEVVRGKELHGLCLPGVDLSIYDHNPARRCAIALTDRFLYPDYIKNYDQDSVPLLNVLDIFSASQTILDPLMDALEKLYKEMCQAPYSRDPNIHVCISRNNTPPPEPKPSLLYRILKWISPESFN